MNPKPSLDQDIFKTGVSISEPRPWFASIARQIRQNREERTAPHAEIFARPDPSALDKFIPPPSLLTSIFATASGMFSDRHRKLEMTAAPIEVDELWSK